jgi:formylglycine-generating enzyme
MRCRVRSTHCFRRLSFLPMLLSVAATAQVIASEPSSGSAPVPPPVIPVDPLLPPLPCVEGLALQMAHDGHGAYFDLPLGKDVVQRFRAIRPGTFTMGSPLTEAGRHDEEIPHQVTLTRGFWLGDCEVSNAVWLALIERAPMDAGGGITRPVKHVTWNECQLFLNSLNQRFPGLHARLPTEAQWEYACRAGTTTAWVRDARELYLVAYLNDYAANHPNSVKLNNKPNAWGLYDMHGNVWEHCADWYGPYPTAAVTDPTGPEQGTLRVIRGGSYREEVKFSRSAFRARNMPDRADELMGFRICLQPDPSPAP